MERKFVGRDLGLAVAWCALLGGAGVASAQVTMVTVPVGNAGNLADPSTGYGAVSYAYNIGKHDVTAAQYTAFLNAVAKTDIYGLYDSSMTTDTSYGCGISQTGTSGNSYSTIRTAPAPSPPRPPPQKSNFIPARLCRATHGA